MQNVMRNLCEFHAESIYVLCMLDSMQHAGFTQISRNFCADFNAECDAESLRNPCGIYLCLMHAWFHAACRFYANFTQILRRLPCRMPSGIFCGIHAESINFKQWLPYWPLPKYIWLSIVWQPNGCLHAMLVRSDRISAKQRRKLCAILAAIRCYIFVCHKPTNI